ncbi:DUF488 domain-containing protein [Marinobacter sp. X15-166B]|uniref:DUF488 domain-containing protein n=1 Tax=Marinobacter sp. X15-166B TaxID=1897620 RepID=UPI00085BC4F8|nr:DUF488 domain-containing protein [Marinobacter sp. X15-166B]OEY65534.1 hypothetical protein BG841_03045 [Marinobacter sp. X15-166B]
MPRKSSVQCKRAYEQPASTDGYRVLVDHIWPRGVSKDALALDDWYKEIAPSDALRKWFDHDPKLWAAFYQKYHAELKDQHPDQVDALLKQAKAGALTLVYAAKDEQHNNAVALKMLLDERL